MTDKKKESKLILDSSLVWVMGVGMAVFTYLGYWADKKYGFQPCGIIGGIFLGLFYCGYEVWKTLKSIDEKNKK